MPPADAAPDPLDRPAAALAAGLMAWCAARSPPDAGAWLPALPFGEWFNWQRDLARWLAAAVLAAAADRPAAGKCPRCRGNTIVPVIDWRLPRPVTGYQPCPNCRGTGKVNDVGRSKATMTAEDLSEAVIRHLQDVGCVTIPDAADGLAPILAAAFREAEAAAAARQREVVLALIRTSRASWDRCPDPDERSAVQAALDVLALAVRSAAGELLGPAAGGGGAGGEW